MLDAEFKKMSFPESLLQRFHDLGKLLLLLLSYPSTCSLLAFVLCALFFGLCQVWGTKILKSPPSPLKLPIIGHLHYLGTLPHRSLQKLSRKYGPLMLLYMGSTPTLVVSSSEMARDIMKTHDTIFSSRPVTKASREILLNGKDLVFAPYGDYWRQMRRICAIDLFSSKRVERFRNLADEEATIMVNKIKESCFLKKDVNLSHVILVASNNITSRNTLGKSLEREEGGKLVEETLSHFGGLNFEDLYPSLGWIDALIGITQKIKRASKEVHNLLDEIIQEHLLRQEYDSQTDAADLVDVLLKCEKDQALGIEFTRENTRAVLLDMFLAGTDTSYATVEWAMAELLSHPNVMNKLQEEVRRVVGEKYKVEEDDIDQMTYLMCVIKETLRLHPPVPLSIPRETTASAILNGYHVPAKTRVLVNLWAISRDPKIWDAPTEFIPDRFVNSSVDFKGKDFQFIPFGAGRRGCPGMALGVISVEYILANLLCWFDWELAGGANNVDMTEAFGISVLLKNKLHLVPVSRFP